MFEKQQAYWTVFTFLSIQLKKIHTHTHTHKSKTYKSVMNPRQLPDNFEATHCKEHFHHFLCEKLKQLNQYSQNITIRINCRLKGALCLSLYYTNLQCRSIKNLNIYCTKRTAVIKRTQPTTSAWLLMIQYSVCWSS